MRQGRPNRFVLAARSLALVLAALVVATGLTFASAEPVPLALTGHFQLRVDGDVDADARIFLTRRGAPRLIVVTSALERPLLVVAGARRAALVEPARFGVADFGADVIELPADALDPGEDATDVKLSRGSVLMTLGGKSLELGQSEPMVGALAPAEILARLPEYRRNAALYEPRLGDVRLLATVEEPTRIDVVFGSWCPHCEQIVPRLLRVIEQVDNPNLVFNFHGVPRVFTEDPLARQLEVKGLPTLVLTRGATPLGRLEGAILDRPEAALSSILFGR